MCNRPLQILTESCIAETKVLLRAAQFLGTLSLLGRWELDERGPHPASVGKWPAQHVACAWAMPRVSVVPLRVDPGCFIQPFLEMVKGGLPAGHDLTTETELFHYWLWIQLNLQVQTNPCPFPWYGADGSTWRKLPYVIRWCSGHRLETLESRLCLKQRDVFNVAPSPSHFMGWGRSSVTMTDICRAWVEGTSAKARLFPVSVPLYPCWQRETRKLHDHFVNWERDNGKKKKNSLVC